MATDIDTRAAGGDAVIIRRNRKSSHARQVQSLAAAMRIIGGTAALISGLMGLLDSTLDLGLIEGLTGTIATLGVFDFRSQMIAAHAHAATTQATISFTFSGLTIAFAMLGILLPRRWPSAGFLGTAMVGGALGGQMFAACMLPAIAGGALVLISYRRPCR